MMRNLNTAKMTGTIQSEVEFNHKCKEEQFYMFILEIERKSGVIDKVPVMISERMIEISKLTIESIIHIEGDIRTYNQHDQQGKSHLCVYIFANKIEFVNKDEYYPQNIVEFEGYLIKQPVFRMTPLGREICDAVIASNRGYKKSSYIPCIFWSRNARYLSKREGGTKVHLKGRFQSRKYLRSEDVGTENYRTAYEVSSFWMTVLDISENVLEAEEE